MEESSGGSIPPKPPDSNLKIAQACMTAMEIVQNNSFNWNNDSNIPEEIQEPLKNVTNSTIPKPTFLKRSLPAESTTTEAKKSQLSSEIFNDTPISASNTSLSQNLITNCGPVINSPNTHTNDTNINLIKNINSKNFAYENNKDNRYNKTDVGPYNIIMESVNKNIGKLHKTTVGKLIFNNFFDDKQHIDNIFPSGRNRVKVTVNNFNTANKILNNTEFLTSNGFIAYIPESLVYRKGIVRNVDPNFTIEEIKVHIKSYIEISNIRRMTRRVTDNNGAHYINTETLVLTFRGQTLPDSISIYGARCKVLPYIYKVIQCSNCFRFGHHQQLCRTEARCENCGDKHNSSTCREKSKCLSCKGEHRSTDPQCPELNNQRDIKKYMAFNNVSYREAKLKYRRFSDVVSSDKQENYPPLSVSNRYSILNSYNNPDDQAQNSPIMSPYIFNNPRRNRRNPTQQSRYYYNNTSGNQTQNNSHDIEIHNSQHESTELSPTTSRGITNPYSPQLHSKLPQPHEENSEDFLDKLCTIFNTLLMQYSSGKSPSILELKKYLSSSFNLHHHG